MIWLWLALAILAALWLLGCGLFRMSAWQDAEEAQRELVGLVVEQVDEQVAVGAAPPPRIPPPPAAAFGPGAGLPQQAPGIRPEGGPPTGGA